ncbi:hypothetical protein [Streptomyces sp. NPDC096033]|uniref:hypothetical protein n=1 Tax=Streptomyces sp. NPDC096033 TaxID=3366071 RepID=UPI0037FB9814
MSDIPDDSTDDDELLAWMESEESWAIPEELRRPANGIASNFAIIVLSSRFTSSSINQAVGALIVESSGFTTWFATEAKGRMNSLDLLKLSETSMRLLRPCWESWKAYEEAHEEQMPKFPIEQAQNLLTSLTAARNGFRTARGL